MNSRFREKFALLIVPTLLAACFAFSWFFPFSDRVPGWGEDPLFNVWTFEHVWSQLLRLGAGEIFSREFWWAPLFHPIPLGLALSENQIYAALVAWPLRIGGAGPQLAMNILALIMSFAAFFFSSLWLRSIGVRRFCWWGGLFFAANGWLQSQYAHFQNICIFLIPLALWSFQLFRARPTSMRLLGCAFAFGWICGWNLYFQIFCNLALVLLVGREFFLRPDLRSVSRTKLFLLLIFVGLIEWPILSKYLELESWLGSFSVDASAVQGLSAHWRSPFSHEHHASWLQRWLPGYPAQPSGIESVGFLGFTWIFLTFASLRIRELRVWALTAFACFWVALGPDLGLWWLLRNFPGFGGIRAIGRIQVMSTLFSLAAVMLLLERMRSFRARAAAVALIALELLPSAMPSSVAVSADIFRGTSELTRFLTITREPVLYFAPMTTQAQLLLQRTGVAHWGGYSGRSPVSADILSGLIGANFADATAARRALEFSRAPRLISVDPTVRTGLSGTPFLSLEGCFEHHGSEACVFRSKLQSPTRLLNLERDTHWENVAREKGHYAILRATADGLLDSHTIDRCRIVERVRLGGWLSIVGWERENPFPSWQLSRTEFKSGEVILDRESNQAIFRLPQGIRPDKTYTVRCR